MVMNKVGISSHDDLTFPKHQLQNLPLSEKNYLHRIIISKLLKAHGSYSLVAKDPKSGVQEWVGEIHCFRPENSSNV